MARRRSILPDLPIVFGLDDIGAAASVGISATKFRELVASKRMPRPRVIDGRHVWDVDEVRAAFKAFPHQGEREVADTWADVA